MLYDVELLKYAELFVCTFKVHILQVKVSNHLFNRYDRYIIIIDYLFHVTTVLPSTL